MNCNSSAVISVQLTLALRKELERLLAIHANVVTRHFLIQYIHNL
jgi:hypothetical protein